MEWYTCNKISYYKLFKTLCICSNTISCTADDSSFQLNFQIVSQRGWFLSPHARQNIVDCFKRRPIAPNNGFVNFLIPKTNSIFVSVRQQRSKSKFPLLNFVLKFVFALTGSNSQLFVLRPHAGNPQTISAHSP